VTSADALAARALASVLQPAGYRVLRVASGVEARERARTARPDLILIATPLPDMNGEELCRELRQDPAMTLDTAIIGITATGTTREQRLRWLRAGAWDCFGFPLDAEELRLKLAGYVGAKRDADDARAAALVDQATGLYNGPGLKRRAQELVAEALRLHTALACALFGPNPRPGDRGDGPDAAARTAIRNQVGRVLRTHARLSDTIGWWNGTDFAVLAPATDADGADQLGRRLADAIEATPPEPGASLPALDVRVGYHTVTDVHATPVEPADLFERASRALALARTGSREARIRRFEAGR